MLFASVCESIRGQIVMHHHAADHIAVGEQSRYMIRPGPQNPTTLPCIAVFLVLRNHAVALRASDGETRAAAFQGPCTMPSHAAACAPSIARVYELRNQALEV